MSVYVDNMYASYRRMKLCHMFADSTDELNDMADKIGVNRKWIQDANTYREHYDVAKISRKRAIDAGAIEINMHELGQLLREKKTLAKEK